MSVAGVPRTPVIRTSSSGRSSNCADVKSATTSGERYARRVVHLVEELMAERVGAHATAGAGRLRDHRRAVGVDPCDRIRQVPGVRERPPVAGVVAAQALARALEQVADEDARGQPVPVVPGPAVLVGERCEEQRRVGDPAGDHDVGALRERVGDRSGAEVRGREQRRRRAATRTQPQCRGGRSSGPDRCGACRGG